MHQIQRVLAKSSFALLPQTTQFAQSAFHKLPALLKSFDHKEVASLFTIHFAQSKLEIQECQALRYKIFAEEMGARLNSLSPGLDEDMFDAYCTHLYIRHRETQEIVGTYRLLTPEQARKLGGYYADSEFFLKRLRSLLPNMVEAGRSCVHADFRNGTVIMLLWSGVAQFMQRYGYQYLIGCASMSMCDGGHQAASLFRRLSGKYIAPPEYQTFPYVPLPLDHLNTNLNVALPPLIKGYLRLGAQVCSAPAWDPDFNTADFLILLSISKMNPRYAKHFGI